MEKHEAKIKLARRLMSRFEIKTHVPLFSSRNWIARAMAIQARIRPKETVTYVTTQKIGWWTKLKLWITKWFV